MSFSTEFCCRNFIKLWNIIDNILCWVFSVQRSVLVCRCYLQSVCQPQQWAVSRQWPAEIRESSHAILQPEENWQDSLCSATLLAGKYQLLIKLFDWQLKHLSDPRKAWGLAAMRDLIRGGRIEYTGRLPTLHTTHTCIVSSDLSVLGEDSWAFYLPSQA